MEQVTALRAEFVVKPGKEEAVQNTIAGILRDSFERERDFLQALVLVSEQETRLMTVITFWHSQGFAEARERRVMWLRKKLTAYLDQWLRVQSYSAHVMESKSGAKAEEIGTTESGFEPHALVAAACVS